VDVAEWLRSLGLMQYEQAFRDNAVDAETLPRLTSDDLKELGVHAVGHRRKLLDAIAHLNATPILAIGGGLSSTERSVAQSASSPPLLQSGAERRQLTVMFCDLVGSTALASTLDPEEYRAILSAYHGTCAETTAKFGGFVAKYMGDGVLAYFGYPQAHEDDAIRAVRTGLALTEDVARVAVPSGLDPLRARVGIATGLVVVGDLIGTGAAQEQSVVGETPNLAARLQTLAPPDGVVIAPATRRLLGSEFKLADLGLQDLKGFAEPVAAWQVLGTAAVESRFEAHSTVATPLIGRAEELGRLAQRWEQARSGDGQVVLLSGEAGIGKSRLAREFRDAVQSEPHAWVQYQCSPFFSNSPLHPFIEQIERAAGSREEETPEERLVKLEVLLAQVTDDVLAIAPLLATMLSIPCGDRYALSPHDPQRQRELTIEALIKSVLGQARRQPLLLLVEDTHWSDPTTLELLDQLVDRIASKHILLLVTFRPEFAVPWQGRRHVTYISLDRLTRHESAELAEGVAGGTEMPAEVFHQILERTDGVPLFVEELTKAVLERESSARSRANTSAAGSRPVAVPATLHDSLMARLDRVPGAKAVAQQAAVIGREFTYDLLAAISPQGVSDLRRALQQLVSSGLIFVSGASPGATYTFKHALVRDAAYESLLRIRRQELHGRIAAILEQDSPDTANRQPELIAHHLSEAHLPERAVTYWQRAADNAARRQSHHEAIAHCMRGLEMVSLIPDLTQRDRHELRLQVRLGNSATSAKGYSAPEVGTALYRARDLCSELGDDRLLHPILVGLYLFHANNAELRTAEKIGLELLALGDARNDRVLRVDGHKTLLNARYKLGKFEEAQEHFARGMRLYEESPWPEALIEQFDDPGPHLLVIGGCVLWVLGYPDRARRAVADAIAVGHRGGHHLSTAHAALMSGHLAELMDDWEGVRRANETTIAITTEWDLVGLRQQVARRERLVAVALHRDPEQMEYKRQHPQPGFARSLHDGVLARAYGRQGVPEEGLQVIEGSLTWTEETGSRFFNAELLRIRAGLLLLMQRTDEAECSYRNALEVAQEQGARMWELRAACDLAQMLCDRGRGAEVRNCLAAVYGWFSEGFDIPELRRSKALLESLSPSHIHDSSIASRDP
jgi:class 3 adenylate cyclase/tetratricopeptide (TPR) repeat protein